LEGGKHELKKIDYFTPDQIIEGLRNLGYNTLLCVEELDYDLFYDGKDICAEVWSDKLGTKKFGMILIFDQLTNTWIGGE